MPTYILRPNGDDKAQWTEVPAGSAWSILNETVTEADTPDTSNNYVDTTTAGQITRQDMETFTLPATEQVVSTEGWWYVRAAVGQTIDLYLYDGLNLMAQAGVSSGAAFGWVSATHPGALSQLVIDGLRVSAVTTGTASSSSSRLAAAFIRVTTALWPPATAGMFDPQLKGEVWF